MIQKNWYEIIGDVKSGADACMANSGPRGAGYGSGMEILVRR